MFDVVPEARKKADFRFLTTSLRDYFLVVDLSASWYLYLAFLVIISHRQAAIGWSHTSSQFSVGIINLLPAVL